MDSNTMLIKKRSNSNNRKYLFIKGKLCTK